MSINDYRDRGYPQSPKQSGYYEERLQCEPAPKCVATETVTNYTAINALDWSDIMIRELADRIERLANVIDFVMEEPSPHCGEDSQPRVNTTPLISRITCQGEVLESLNRRVENMIGRVRL